MEAWLAGVNLRDRNELRMDGAASSTAAASMSSIRRFTLSVPATGDWKRSSWPFTAGTTGTLPPRLVRNEVAKLVADPKCGRRRLLEGLDAFVQAIRTRGLSAADHRRP
jgi:hypothetical protein